MSIRDCYENILIELNKVQAPSLLLNDFVYLFNKGVQEYYNEKYNLFETKQQLTDDLRVLTRTKKLIPTVQTGGDVFGKSYRTVLPDDYVHILNCICEFKDNRPRCEVDAQFQQGANKLNTNQWSHVINNYYLKPSVKNPYYYIINIEDPTQSNKAVRDDDKKLIANLGNDVRYGNSVMPIMQIKCGNDPRYTLEAVYIDYLRAPKYYSLNEDLLDSIQDNSQILEFPDYVTYEIINRIVMLVMENAKDQRVQTHAAVNKTIL